MTTESSKLKPRILDRIDRVTAAEWDACAGADNPFVSHAFLKALEDSRSVGGRSGWTPQHMVLEDSEKHIAAAVPLYVKSHSQGEYVFDHGWGEAFERAGGQYYPKLQVAVPFSPVPGPRLLTRPGEQARSALIEGLIGAVEGNGFSSAHVTFCGEAEALAMQEAGFLHRLGCQYHWHNRGYAEFGDFLGALNSRKRKAIRKERQSVAATGLTISALQGTAIEKRHWEAFFAFYMDTGSRKWGRPYLTRSFFDLLGAALGDRVVLMLAEENGRPVAGALNLLGSDCLYGRNWGCLEEYRFLHFELCYYQAIDFAIRHGLARVEAGAQGEHKIQRGYLPVATHSAHWIAHEGFRGAVASFLDRERPAMLAEIAALDEYGPYRQEGSG